MNETLFVFSWAFKLRVIMMEQLRKQYLYFCAFLSKVLHVWSLIYIITKYKAIEVLKETEYQYTSH